MHDHPHPLAGVDVTLIGPGAPATPVHVDDWADRIPRDRPTALATAAALEAFWEDDEDVVYGHIGSLAVLVRACELGHMAAGPTPAWELLRAWQAS